VGIKKSQNTDYKYFGIFIEILKVELAGIEPASKQGSLRLSTCLSYD